MRLDDVQRSTRRWLWLALGDAAWTLRDARFEVPDDQRPAGYVEPSTSVSTPFARAAIPQGDVQRRVTITCTMYPVTDGTAEECQQRATQLADELEACVTHGVVVPGPPEQVLGYPGTLPLWSFIGVSLDEVPAGPPIAFADVDSTTARPIPDPLDDRRWSVVLEMRLSWWAAGRSRRGLEPEPVVVEVPPVFVPVVP